MRMVEILQQPDDRALVPLVEFVDEITADTGTRPLSDHLWLDLSQGGSDGFVGVRIADADRTLAVAQVSGGNDVASLEVVVRDDIDDREQLSVDAAETAIDAFRTGGGALSWWVDDPTEAQRAVADRYGLRPARSLYEMRRSLPTDDHATVPTRSFVPGHDDRSWLDVNNRAFADHAEQGGWTIDALRRRLAEPWFDADGFRLHERDGRLAAFCWTKLHDGDPPIGEIYVIAVDPDFHGQGLGKQLTLAGLDSIAARGVTIASLYVDADNAAAVGLYDRLGFTVHRTRRAFVGTP